jgi:hypothetical protein
LCPAGVRDDIRGRQERKIYRLVPVHGKNRWKLPRLYYSRWLGWPIWRNRRGWRPGCGFDGCGTIFTIDRRGGFKTLYAFTPIFPNNEGGSCPIRDARGNLYGTHGADTGAHSGGYVYQLNTKGEYTDIFDFPIIESPLGSDPSGVVLSPNGVFYGTAVLGGDTRCGVENSGCGTVFSLTLSAR